MIKIINFFKENYKYILVLIILYVGLTIKIPYSIECPGGTISSEERLSNVKYKSRGSFNLTYVSFINGTIPTVLLALIIPNWDIVKNNDVTLDGESIKESFKRDQISLKSSISNAKYVAYKEANISLSIKSIDNLVVYKDKDSNTNLSIGDNILKYDNYIYDDINIFKEYINSKEIGEKIEFLISNNDKKETKYAIVRKVDNKKQIGILVNTIYNYDDNNSVNYQSKSSEAGSSGGLMISLAIYNSLVKEDITKGKKICGTGTISNDGTIGEISGVKYKLMGAKKNKCDVFIAPKDNYKEVLEVIKNNKYDIKTIEGITFNQVLEELKNI